MVNFAFPAHSNSYRWSRAGIPLTILWNFALEFLVLFAGFWFSRIFCRTKTVRWPSSDAVKLLHRSFGPPSLACKVAGKIAVPKRNASRTLLSTEKTADGHVDKALWFLGRCWRILIVWLWSQDSKTKKEFFSDGKEWLVRLHLPRLYGFSKGCMLIPARPNKKKKRPG